MTTSVGNTILHQTIMRKGRKFIRKLGITTHQFMFLSKNTSGCLPFCNQFNIGWVLENFSSTFACHDN